MSTRRDVTAVLDSDFLEVRHRLLDLAAMLDRIDRAPNPPVEPPDVRLAQIRMAIEALLGPNPDRAETVQMIFSRDYDAEWQTNLAVHRG